MTFRPPIKPLTGKPGFWERPPSVVPIPAGLDGQRLICGVTWDQLRWRERLWYWRPRWALKIPVLRWLAWILGQRWRNTPPLRYRVVFDRIQTPEVRQWRS